METTLILARHPVREFTYGIMSGRWGELIAIRGPKILQAVLATREAFARMMGYQRIQIDNRWLHLSTDDQPIVEVKRYTSMERFRANSGPIPYVRLRPQSDPYQIQMEIGNPVVATLWKGHDGKCFRIHGGRTFKERAILIHEAPNVSWLTGCISPRPLGDMTRHHDNIRVNPSRKALEDLFQFFGKGRSNFFVSTEWT